MKKSVFIGTAEEKNSRHVAALVFLFFPSSRQSTSVLLRGMAPFNAFTGLTLTSHKHVPDTESELPEATRNASFNCVSRDPVSAYGTMFVC
jgi:hypothetical protein